VPTLATREPGGAPGAERLRALLLSAEQDWSPSAEVLLHFAARAEHVARTIAPALAAGTWVVCDRFYDSTMAYQGYGQGADRAMIATLSGLIGLRPDLTIVFDIDPAIGRARLLARDIVADRYERLDAAFHARVAAGFRVIAAAEPERCVVIDASASEQDVARQVADAIADRFALPTEAP